MNSCEVFVHYHNEDLLQRTEPFRTHLTDFKYIQCGHIPRSFDTRNILRWSDFPMYHRDFPESFLGYQAYRLASHSTKDYVVLLEYDCKVYPEFYTELNQCIERNVDLLSFAPLPLQDVYVGESNEFTWAVCEYLQELGISYQELTKGYTVWAPTPAILVRTKLLREFFESDFFKNFTSKYHDKSKFAHQIERLLSVYFMWRKYSIQGSSTTVIHHCMANSHNTASDAIIGSTDERINNVLNLKD